MLSRRHFMGWVAGCLAGLGIERWGDPEAALLKKEGRPEESLQDLIRQVGILEGTPGTRVHIRALEDQIRVRLFLAGLACKYQDERGKNRLCVLCTQTGSLLTVSLNEAGWPNPRREIEGLGLGHVLNDLRSVPWARDI